MNCAIFGQMFSGYRMVVDILEIITIEGVKAERKLLKGVAFFQCNCIFFFHLERQSCCVLVAVYHWGEGSNALIVLINLISSMKNVTYHNALW